MEETISGKKLYDIYMEKAEKALVGNQRLNAAEHYISAIEAGEEEVRHAGSSAEEAHYREGIEFCYNQLEILLPKRKDNAVKRNDNATRRKNAASSVESRKVSPLEHVEVISDGYFQPVETGTTFDDVAGMDYVKDVIRTEIITPLLHPELYKDFVGSGEGSGIILYGPPGCGKTYMANTAAGQASKESGQRILFFKVDHGELLDKYVGETQKNIANYFMTLAENEPCIGFIDEFDSLAKKRSKSRNSPVEVVNSLLAAFNYLEGKNVILLAGTNRPWEVDSALARSGRFGTKIFVPPPDFESRRETFEIHLRGKPIDEINFDALAGLTEAYSNADIKSICRLAGKSALNDYLAKGRTEKSIGMDDLIEAVSQTDSSLLLWANEIRQELIDWRYSDRRIKARYNNEYDELLGCANWIKETLEGRIDDGSEYK